jgi:hypothetical protein
MTYFQDPVFVKPNDATLLNATLVPSQEFINAYRTKNRILRGIFVFGAAMAAWWVAAGLGAYAAWILGYLAVSPETDKTAVLLSLLRFSWPPTVSDAQVGGKPGLVVFNVLGALVLVAPPVALGFAGLSALFWFIGDDPGRYNQYST